MSTKFAPALLVFDMIWSAQGFPDAVIVMIGDVLM